MWSEEKSETRAYAFIMLLEERYHPSRRLPIEGEVREEDVVVLLLHVRQDVFECLINKLW